MPNRHTDFRSPRGKRSRLRRVPLPLLFAGALLALPAFAFATTSLSGVDLNGHSVSLARSTAPAVVLFFTASDCPISNRYEPELLRLQREFRSVEFYWVYPNPGDTAAVIRLHQAQFGGGARVLRDTDQTLTHAARATVTPEAAIFIPDNGSLREVYRGRIDDRYIAFGEERPRASHHDLENAIVATLAKRATPQPGGPPVGCSIVPLGLQNQ